MISVSFKKFFCAALLILLASCSAQAAYKATPDELKRMSIFISNFTEAGFFNFDLLSEFTDEEQNDSVGEYEEPKTHLGMPGNLPELIKFGIVHNLINNPKRIVKCTDRKCEAGSLKLDKKFADESIKKYFDIDISKKDLSIIQDDPSAAFSFDGKFYHFGSDSFKEPGNDTVYYADVQGVTQRGSNLMLAGELYNSKNKTDRPGMFAATVKRIKWQGKATWAIIDMTTDWVTNAGRD